MGRIYHAVFSRDLVQTFLSCFEAVEKPVRDRMIKVLKTWPAVYKDQYAALEAGVARIQNGGVAAAPQQWGPMVSPSAE